MPADMPAPVANRASSDARNSGAVRKALLSYRARERSGGAPLARCAVTDEVVIEPPPPSYGAHAAGEAGELVISSPTTTPGYLLEVLLRRFRAGITARGSLPKAPNL
jgi:hypothetical protein